MLQLLCLPSFSEAALSDVGEEPEPSPEEDGEKEEVVDQAPKKESLRNQFNFSERASQTFNNPYRVSRKTCLVTSTLGKSYNYRQRQISMTPCHRIQCDSISVGTWNSYRTTSKSQLLSHCEPVGDIWCVPGRYSKAGTNQFYLRHSVTVSLCQGWPTCDQCGAQDGSESPRSIFPIDC